MRGFKAAGLLLVVVGCVGFGTVADDLRHTGELFAVGGILIAGVLLLAAGSDHPLARGLALHWVAFGIGIGGAAGEALDHVPAGVVGGAVLGVLVAAMRSFGRSRRSRA